MPFTPPSTVASVATTGYQATLLIGSVASPLSLNAISEMKSFKANLVVINPIDVTHLLSPNYTEETIPGMLKLGSLDLSGNLIGDASQLAISALAVGATIFAFQIKASMQRGGKTYTLTGTGFFSKYDPGPFENNKAIEYTASIQMAGAYTETCA